MLYICQNILGVPSMKFNKYSWSAILCVFLIILAIPPRAQADAVKPSVNYTETFNEGKIIHRIQIGVNYDYGEDNSLQDQWMQISLEERTDLNGARFQYNNHWKGRDPVFYYMQQFDIHAIKFYTGTQSWIAELTTADSFIGCGEDGIIETELENGWQHEFWMMAVDLDVVREGDGHLSGTVDFQLNFTLQSLDGENIIKFGIELDLEDIDLQLNENDKYNVSLTFENRVEDRTNNEYGGGPWVEPHLDNRYEGHFSLPNDEITSSMTLDRNYVEKIDEENVQKQADPYLSIPPENNQFTGIYDFPDLIYGHTTHLELDPSLSTHFHIILPSQTTTTSSESTTTTTSEPATTPAIPPELIMVGVGTAAVVAIVIVFKTLRR